jgi:hypothetical protein
MARALAGFWIHALEALSIVRLHIPVVMRIPFAGIPGSERVELGQALRLSGRRFRLSGPSK